MKPASDQLVVRQHDRHECRLAAELRISERHGGHVVLSRSVGDGAGVLKGTVVDISTGGLGVECAVFLPKGCRVRVKVTAPRPGGADGETDEFEAVVRVQRVMMLDRAARYYVGTAFGGDAGEGTQAPTRLTELLEAARASSQRGKAVA